MFEWYDQNPEGYWGLVFIALAGMLAAMLWPFVRDQGQSENRSDWWWSLPILAVLAAGRWPTWFVTREFNVDESQMLVGALTLRHDPVFWRSVDGMTAGPLDFYALLPAGLIFGGDSYLSARVTAWFLIGVALIFAHQTLAALFGRQLARMAVFPAVCVESLTLHRDLLHYSTELVPVTLLSIIIYLFVHNRIWGGRWRMNLVAGLLMGAVPLAKIQAAPIAAVLAIAWIIAELIERRHGQGKEHWENLVALGIGLSITPLIFAAMITLNDLWPYVSIAYFRHNVAYVDAAATVPLFDILIQLMASAERAFSLLGPWLIGGLLCLMLSLPLAKGGTRMEQLIAGLAVIILITSLVCILIPHRPFLHYFQLLIVPWTLVLGINSGLILRARKSPQPLFKCVVLCATMFCCVTGVFYARAGVPIPPASQLALHQALPQGAVAHQLNQYAKPGEALGIWGWMPNFHVEAGLRQVTRRIISPAEIPDGPFTRYFRTVDLEDLQRTTPPVFVDATGPGNFGFHDRKHSFKEIFPQLAEFIDVHYVFDREVEGARIYVRRDRWTLLNDTQLPSTGVQEQRGMD